MSVSDRLPHVCAFAAFLPVWCRCRCWCAARRHSPAAVACLAVVCFDVDRYTATVLRPLRFIVSPADAAITPVSAYIAGFACCSRRRVFLTGTPELFRYYLT